MNSCVSRKNIVYFQDLDKVQQEVKGETPGLTIKPNDLLTINVSAPEQAAAMPFNLPVVGMPKVTEITWAFRSPEGNKCKLTWWIAMGI